MPNSSNEGLRTRAMSLGVAMSVGALALQPYEADTPTVSSNESIEAVHFSVLPEQTITPGLPGRQSTPHRASRNRQRVSGSDLGMFESTCYNLRGITASGKPAGYGKVAVDPDVIPLGTRLYISGYGESIAADTGGAIDGRIVDIWKPTRAQCLKWGRRMVQVTQLADEHIID